MIEIQFYQNGFHAQGHAFTAPYGQDLVCAAVSAILMGSLNWFAPGEADGSTKIQIDQTNGIWCLFDSKRHPEYAQWLTLLQAQLAAIPATDGSETGLTIRYYKTKGEFHDN